MLQCFFLLLFQRNTLQLPKISQKSHVNWYLEQF